MMTLMTFLNKVFDQQCTGVENVESLAKAFRIQARQNVKNRFTAKSPKLEQFLITHAHQKIKPVIVWRSKNQARLDFEVGKKKVTIFTDLETLKKLKL